ncbi:hypothetical protein PsYK624_065700 [Phanerochaete sordida]|uniref:Uncharacterized protein n=1 Tax=Phanerochaete sordida TaxID=48140 RepID=A0A9P3G9B1_9APHY|nr:hypothetical protein PsYK624_065700 [Phanerochaete sordida]
MTFATIVPRLPAELTDMVIDHLWDSKPALAAASLVARAWLPRSRVHKFAQVCVESDFAGLRTTLQHTPLLRPYIRTLVLRGPDAYSDAATDDDAAAPDAPRAVLAPVLLAELLQLLPRLHTLHLHRLSLHAPPAHTTALPGFALHRLARLALVGVGGPHDTAGDVLRVLALFADIGSLHLEGLAHAPAPAPPAHWACDRRVRVGAVKIENAPTDTCLELLRAAGAPRALRALEAEVADGEDAAALARLLAEAGPAVEHVAVDLAHCFRPAHDAEDPADVFLPAPQAIADTLGAGLALCTGLRRAAFVVPADEPDADAWACLVHALKRVPAATPELEVRLSAESWEEQVPLERLGLAWDELRDVLRRFTALRAVTVGLADDSPWALEAEDAEYVQRQLDVLAERGVLHVEVGF